LVGVNAFAVALSFDRIDTSYQACGFRSKGMPLFSAVSPTRHGAVT
jgi:hypothetical protein